jgi:hypothetical protein
MEKLPPLSRRDYKKRTLEKKEHHDISISISRSVSISIYTSLKIIAFPFPPKTSLFLREAHPQILNQKRQGERENEDGNPEIFKPPSRKRLAKPRTDSSIQNSLPARTPD